jgi:hypothetical protein
VCLGLLRFSWGDAGLSGNSLCFISDLTGVPVFLVMGVFGGKKYLVGVGSGFGTKKAVGPCNASDWTSSGLGLDLPALGARFGFHVGSLGSVWNPFRLSGIHFWMTFL